jgi:hypothetical protein
VRGVAPRAQEAGGQEELRGGVGRHDGRILARDRADARQAARDQGVGGDEQRAARGGRTVAA